MTVRRGALIGFGNVAEKGHLPVWREREDVRIVAVADANPGRRALATQLIPNARVYADSATLLSEQEIDFVDIATPPAMHASSIVQAAQRGAHILCEKPLMTSPDDFRLAARAAREANVTLFTVHNWKHSEPFRYIRRTLEEGVIGDICKVRFETIRNGQSVTVGEEWRTRANVAGGGILVDHGWHAFYLLLGLVDARPLRIAATTERRRYTEVDVEDTVTCRVFFERAEGEIHLTWAGDGRRTSWHVEGTHGSLTLIEDRLKLESKSAREEVRFEQSLSAGSHHPDWFGAVVEEFFAEVDDPVRRGTNLREAGLCLELLSRAYQSAAQNGRALPLEGIRE